MPTTDSSTAPGNAPLGMEFYETDLFIPSYQEMSGERWHLHVTPLSLSRGYWSDVRLTRNLAVLKRLHPEGWRTWMSTAPMEMESQELGCRAAVGDTLVMGLGMGWAAANAALRPEVTRVTVVERDPEVIRMVGETGVFAQLPAAAAAKIAIIEGDALEYTPEAPADTLLADIWMPINGGDRVEQVRRMHANTGATRIYFWGQELFIAKHARDSGRVLDATGIAAVIAEMGLPLIGPEWPQYPEWTATAAERWLED